MASCNVFSVINRDRKRTWQRLLRRPEYQDIDLLANLTTTKISFIFGIKYLMMTLLAHFVVFRLYLTLFATNIIKPY